MNVWFVTVPLSIAGSYLYRRGGTNAGTLWRDVGIPLCMIAFFVLTGNWHPILILCFGLTWGAQTTYFKRKGTDAQWHNWLFVGLAFSFALLPYAIATGHWGGFGWRTLIVTGFTVCWSVFWGVDFVEEWGRGWIQIITLPILLL